MTLRAATVLSANPAARPAAVGCLSTDPIKDRAKTTRAHVKAPEERVKLAEVFNVKVYVLRDSGVPGYMKNVS